jgi:DNA-binding CsgD family transcriptional regulator
MVRGVAAGQAATLLISGEAGVGKTALVGAVCSRVADIADVVWATCLPLTSFAVPFDALVGGLREWAAGRRVAVPTVLRGSDGRPVRDEPMEFDAWLDEACQRRPMLLVVDDLQWADQSSLDVLMYVLAGPADRRVAVLATLRAHAVREGDPLRRWLAHVRRLPGVDELDLGRLDRAATAEQLAGLLGGPPRQALVDMVFARTRGNAYLTTLLARGLPPDATSLPAGLPTALREAVAHAWDGLSTPARELTRLLAVAGRPQPAHQLDVVARVTGVAGEVVPLLREAVDGGVVGVDADERYWFTHPLLAEVLEQGLLPDERRSRHAAFAALDPGSAENVDVEQAVALADHHHQAGHRELALQWALRGAEAADAVGGQAEMLRLLRRALDLHAAVPDEIITRSDLLQRIRAAAERAGDQMQELAAIEALLAIEDRERQPLFVTELMVRRNLLREETGRDFAAVADATEAVNLSAGFPDSAEHALAMAFLARAEMWRGIPSGPARAEEAVDRATACGSAKALTYALIVRVQARIVAGQDGGLADAERAQAAAAEARDFTALTWAVVQATWNIDGTASRPVIEYVRRGRQQLTSLGAPHIFVARLSVMEAIGLLLLGDWRGCVERLRVVLGSTPGSWADAQARLASALLACRQGRWTEAQAHLDRAEELFTEMPRHPDHAFAAVRAELAVATGETERAIAVALAGMQADGLAGGLIERLMPLAARAAADLVQTLHDRGDDPAPATARLIDLQRRHPTVAAEEHPGPTYAAQVHAMQTLYEAELRRGQHDPSAALAWSGAAQACAAAELRWDEAYAQWRLAQILLADRSSRDAAVVAVRRAHELAVDLQAAPLRADVEALARSAAVPLDTGAGPTPMTTALPLGLTPREREVLALVVAGRTYRQIAREMVISEKTVSVHISNLLRKTHTSNRIELTQLVHRLAGPTRD